MTAKYIDIRRSNNLLVTSWNVWYKGKLSGYIVECLGQYLVVRKEQRTTPRTLLIVFRGHSFVEARDYILEGR